MSGADTGVLVGIVIGGAWGAAGVGGLPQRHKLPGFALSVMITAALAVAMFLLPRHDLQAGTFRSGVYGLAVALETVAIVIAATVFQRNHRKELIAPVIGLIVGLHFLGLWAATGLFRFVWIATAMSGVCLFALFLARTNRNGYGTPLAVSGIGCALVQWLAAAVSLFG